jgi:hypothetical protein
VTVHWRRERLARAVPEQASRDAAAALLMAAGAGQILGATYLTADLEGPWPPARHLVAALPLLAPLVSLGLQRAPRVGAALVVLTLGISAAVLGDIALGGGGWIEH